MKKTEFRMGQPAIYSKSILVKLKKIVLENKDKVFKEIRETRELYDLMLKWSAGETLTHKEKAAVKSQLMDICKTIPALAVFMIPFGSVILALLIKFLPFNILPSSFDEDEVLS